MCETLSTLEEHRITFRKMSKPWRVYSLIGYMYTYNIAIEILKEVQRDFVYVYTK